MYKRISGLADRYKIRSMPTLIVLKDDGKEEEEEG
jgi:thioredoxin-related protein